MKRDHARYEVFPAQAILVGGRVRIIWSWQQIARSGAIRHAVLFDTLEDCLESINRRCHRHTPPAIRVILNAAEAPPVRI